MKEIAKLAIDHLAKNGVQYADARCTDGRRETIAVKNTEVDSITDQTSRGIGIRVLDKGAWGFASTCLLSEEQVIACADHALQISRASALTVSEPVKLDDRPAQTGNWVSPRQKDPFEVPLSDKIVLLKTACETLMGDERITTAKGHLKFIHEKKFFLDTEGADIFQDVLHCGGAIIAIAKSDGDVQVRSFPSSHDGDWAAGGYEWIESLKLSENAERVCEEAIALLSAPECPQGEIDLVIAGPQLALQIHESCGHPTELDRALGTEISLAGGSFMTPDRLGSLQYGSSKVNLYGDATIPGALGSFGWDDEGVPATRFDIVREGLFVGYQTSRETAAQLGQNSNGTMRADGWARTPLIRMTNINLAADPTGPTIEDLIADTKKGIFLDVNKSWSIDDLRLNFSFGCEYGRIIENGKLGSIVKNPVYTAITPQFWGSCDAVANQAEWRVWGVANCGKGQPMQIARVGHGCSAARFTKIQVGRKK